MALKGNNMAPFHSALNPLDYYHDQDDEDERRQFYRFAEENKRKRDEEEVLKYEDNQFKDDYCYDEEIDPDDKISSGSFDDGLNMNQDSNRDKPRSFSNSIPNNNSREFKSNHETELSRSIKRDHDINHTLELSPEGA